MRAIERHGGAEILNRAFTGFAALPEKASQSWRQVLGFQEAESVTLEQAESRFKDLARALHSDRGGNDDSMRDLLEAREAARRDFAAKRVGV
jgi:hypothetical protein